MVNLRQIVSRDFSIRPLVRREGRNRFAFQPGFLPNDQAVEVCQKQRMFLALIDSVCTAHLKARFFGEPLCYIRYRTETSTDPETGETTTEEVPYEYYILNVTLTNKTLPAVILPRLNEQQREIYTVMQQLKGNKPYLWEGLYNGGEDTGPSYEIPGEALDDPAFAALMEEATKYIGWPYVWGGSSPSASFDCSGFVCWVYTASGVHNLPRTTAQGIYNQCAIISPSEAKPGDIIFFTGTYDSPGPVSHVGIYVGDGMMLHCGSPIQYANINSSYWQTHFYAFGRL